MTKRRDATRKTLELAFQRVKHGRTRCIEKGRKLSIVAVAEEAGVTSALIHNYYPDLAEQIRAAIGKTVRAQRDGKVGEIQELKNANRQLRNELREFRAKYEKLASENARLILESIHLKAIQDAENVVALPLKN